MFRQIFFSFSFIVLSSLLLTKYQQKRLAIDRTEGLSIEQNSYRQNRMATDRTEQLSIEQNSYRQNRMPFDRTEWLSIEHNMAYLELCWFVGCCLWRAGCSTYWSLLLTMPEFNKTTIPLRNIFHQIVGMGAMILVNITREKQQRRSLERTVNGGLIKRLTNTSTLRLANTTFVEIPMNTIKESGATPLTRKKDGSYATCQSVISVRICFFYLNEVFLHLKRLIYICAL